MLGLEGLSVATHWSLKAMTPRGQEVYHGRNGLGDVRHHIGEILVAGANEVSRAVDRDEVGICNLCSSVLAWPMITRYINNTGSLLHSWQLAWWLMLLSCGRLF